MDWPVDYREFGDADLGKVFRYKLQATTVIRFLNTDTSPKIWSNETASDWNTWLQNCAPSVDKDSGLVLILARRNGASNNLSQGILEHRRVDSSRTLAFNEKDRSFSWPTGHKILNDADAPSPLSKRKVVGGRLDVRHLPFDEQTFHAICQKFHVHASITRVISRADVPLFSRAEVMMRTSETDKIGCRALIYNCRSANAWRNDLAMTITHFPHSRLTFAILFGCTLDIEKRVFNGLTDAKEHVCHPLTLPGLFAELERTRMVEVVETTIDQIEAAIYSLDSGLLVDDESSDIEDSAAHDSGARTRRRVWLNTAFLRNMLRIWKTQMNKMVEHVEELAVTNFGRRGLPHDSSPLEDKGNISRQQTLVDDESGMEHTNRLIKDRLRALIEEFDEKIGDCSMRVDGMAMATQWAQTDTNVDIALATAQDSSQMRSIALVTMIFLPGTFFATLFSMTFFNWFPSEGSPPTVSSYVWIYFLLTVVFTAGTLIAWYYFMGFRQIRSKTGGKQSRFQWPRSRR